jgi:hypothetical protein
MKIDDQCCWKPSGAPRCPNPSVAIAEVQFFAPRSHGPHPPAQFFTGCSFCRDHIGNFDAQEFWRLNAERFTKLFRAIRRATPDPSRTQVRYIAIRKKPDGKYEAIGYVPGTTAN